MKKYLLKLLGIQSVQTKGMAFQGMMIGAAPIYLNWMDNNEFLNSDSVYTIVKKASTKAAAIPMYVYRTKGDAKKYFSKKYFNPIEKLKSLEEADTSSPFAKLLNRPNESQGADSFFDGLFSFRFLKGEAFIWLNRGGIEGGAPVEMYLLPPHKVQLIPDPTDLYGVLGYKFDVGGSLVTLPKEDVIHWKSFNPEFDGYSRTHLRGLSPLKPLNKRIQQDTDSTDAAVAMYQNGGAKGILFNKDLADLTPEQVIQLKSVVDYKINNKEMKAAVATLNGEWGYLNLGLNSVDMELLEAQEMGLKRICAAFGVPYELFQSDTTFANKELALKEMITNTIMPLCYSLRDELNRVLSPVFGGLVCDYDFGVLPELQDDMKKMAEAAQVMWWITPNEKRVLNGYDELPNPEMSKIYAPAGIEPIENLTIPNESNTIGKYNDYLTT